MGGGSPSRRQAAAARDLGRQIALHGWVLLTGGRDAGVMAEASAGAKEVPGSLVVGILPSRATRVARDVDVAIFTDLMHGRNNVNVLSSDVIVACGVAGPGTASEVALALKNGKPVILLGASAAARRFFSSIGGRLLHVARGSSGAIDLIRTKLRIPGAAAPRGKTAHPR